VGRGGVFNRVSAENGLLDLQKPQSHPFRRDLKASILCERDRTCRKGGGLFGTQHRGDCVGKPWRHGRKIFYRRWEGEKNRLYERQVDAGKKKDGKGGGRENPTSKWWVVQGQPVPRRGDFALSEGKGDFENKNPAMNSQTIIRVFWGPVWKTKK